MQIYLDTANLKEIEAAARWGVLSGLTTDWRARQAARAAEEALVLAGHA